MTITQNVASKLVVSFVAVSMLFSLSFSPAKAATAAELQAQIDQLLLEIKALGGTSSSSCSASFTMDLTMGATGASVTALQNFLISKGHTIAAGATGYFGSQTQAALAAYQSANGITPAVGYFGPITRAKVNASCTTGGTTGGGTTGGGTTSGLSGEASLDTFEINDGEESDVEEGDEDMPIAEFDIEFTDGDALITRIDVAASSSSAGEEDAWDTFDEFSLWVDDEEVGRVSASDEDDYLDEDDGSLRFSGLDIVAEEDEQITVVLAVSVQGSVDDIPATWNVTANSIRFTDGDDVVTTEDDFDEMGQVVSFDIEEEGEGDELEVNSLSADDDLETTLALEDDGRSDWIEVFMFELSAEDSDNDIEIRELPIHFTFSSSTLSALVSDARLVIDGEEFDDYSNSGATTTFDFDSEDLVIDAGESVEVTLELEFNALALGDEGTTMIASTTASSYEAEGSDDLEGNQLSGSAESETRTLRTDGVNLTAGDMDSELQPLSDSSSTDDRAVYTLKFDVKAEGEDVFVAKTAAKSTSTTPTAAGVYYFVTDGSGTEKDATTTTQQLSSTADTSGGQFVVRDGETETFTLSVTIDPDITGYYAVNLFGLNYKESSAGTATTQQRAIPVANFETPSENIPD